MMSFVLQLVCACVCIFCGQSIPPPIQVFAYGACSATNCGKLKDSSVVYFSSNVNHSAEDTSILTASSEDVIAISAANGTTMWSRQFPHGLSELFTPVLYTTQLSGIDNAIIIGYTTWGPPQYSHVLIMDVDSQTFVGSASITDADPQLRSLTLGHLNPIANSSSGALIVAGIGAGLSGSPDIYVFDENANIVFDAQENSIWRQNLCLVDITGDGADDILVARGGGDLSVVSFDGTATQSSKPGVGSQTVYVQGESCPTIPNSAWVSWTWARTSSFRFNNDTVIVVLGRILTSALPCNSGTLPTELHVPFLFKTDFSLYESAEHGLNWTQPSYTAIPELAGYIVIHDVNWAVIEDYSRAITIADLEFDGYPELIYSGFDGYIHCFSITDNVNEPYDWPFRINVANGVSNFYEFASDVSVVDIDGDGYAEVIFVSYASLASTTRGSLFILSYTGLLLHRIELPVKRGGTVINGGIGAPTLLSIPGSNLRIIVNTRSSGIVEYEVPNSTSAFVQSGTAHSNFHRDGKSQLILNGTPWWTVPTKDPTEAPTREPTGDPTQDPTSRPTRGPTYNPTEDPTRVPTGDPTSHPTQDPTSNPTSNPTILPTEDPTGNPTHVPTNMPTQGLTPPPTRDPTRVPTGDPTQDPTQDPTSRPTRDPTDDPTRVPTDVPTQDPTSRPTQDPTSNPTILPIRDPTRVPTEDPTRDPTHVPTGDPTGDPTHVPTREPTNAPTYLATNDPTRDPTRVPTNDPTRDPTHAPTLYPTQEPTSVPSTDPTGQQMSWRNVSKVDVFAFTLTIRFNFSSNATIDATAKAMQNATDFVIQQSIQNTNVNTSACPESDSSVDVAFVSDVSVVINATMQFCNEKKADNLQAYFEGELDYDILTPYRQLSILSVVANSTSFQVTDVINVREAEVQNDVTTTALVTTRESYAAASNGYDAVLTICGAVLGAVVCLFLLWGAVKVWASVKEEKRRAFSHDLGMLQISQTNHTNHTNQPQHHERPANQITAPVNMEQVQSVSVRSTDGVVGIIPGSVDQGMQTITTGNDDMFDWGGFEPGSSVATSGAILRSFDAQHQQLVFDEVEEDVDMVDGAETTGRMSSAVPFGANELIVHNFDAEDDEVVIGDDEEDGGENVATLQ